MLKSDFAPMEREQLMKLALDGDELAQLKLSFDDLKYGRVHRVR